MKMNKRLYFVLPDVDTALAVERELLLAKIEDRRMHFMAKPGTELHDLPRATFFQSSDIVHGLWLGLFTGGLTGVGVGLLVRMVPEFSDFLGLGSLLIFAVLGAGFGIWTSGMIAAGMPNTQLKEFEQTIEEGHVLMLVDIPTDRVEEINQLLKAHWPDLDMHIHGPAIPAFP
jgi:hypothetical protein